MLRAVTALFAFTLLSGCASLTQTQCETGDWYAIGLRDGKNGRLPGYISQNAKACAKYGITPDVERWKNGRTEGLLYYCTPENAYRLGRSGRTPSPVCTPEQSAAMALPNETGQRYYRISERINNLRSDLQVINARIAETGTTNPELTRYLVAQRADIELKIQRLELYRLRYSTWP